MSAIARPCANATPTRSAPTAIAATPTKISVNAPMNSAAPRRSQSSFTAQKARPRPGRCPPLRWVRERCAAEGRRLRRRVPALPQALSRRATQPAVAAHRGLQVPALPPVRRLRAPRRAGRDRGLDAILEALRLRKRLELLQRVVLDLTDTLARDAERAADLLERARLLAEQAEAQLDDLALPHGERVQRALDVLAPQLHLRRVVRRLGGLVGNEVAERRLFFLADRLLERDGQL